MGWRKRRSKPRGCKRCKNPEHPFFWYASGRRGMGWAMNEIKKNAAKDGWDISAKTRGVVCNLNRAKVGVGKKLVSCPLGCDENWFISWVEGKMKGLVIDNAPDPKNPKSCDQCGTKGVIIVDCDCIEKSD